MVKRGSGFVGLGLLATGAATLGFAAWSTFGPTERALAGPGALALFAMLQVFSGLTLLRRE